MRSLMLLCSLLLVFVLFTGGCASVDDGKLTKKMDVLESRVDGIERNQLYGTEMGEERSIEAQQVAVVEIKDGPLAGPGKTADKGSMTRKEIQIALMNAGYYKGPIDGKLGKKSKKAIKDFQRKNGLKVDGVAGPVTRKALADYLLK